MGFLPQNAARRIDDVLPERRLYAVTGYGGRPGRATWCGVFRVGVALAACCGLLCVSMIPVQADAAFEFQAVGARPGGLGNTFAGWAEGVEGVFWNPGAVAWGKGVSVTAGYERPFGMAAMDAHAIGTLASTGRMAVGLGYLEYGFSLYRERTAGLTVGLRVASRLGLGLRIRRMQLSVAGADSRAWTAFDLGTRIAFGPKFILGLSTWNAGGQSVDVLGQGGTAGRGVSGRTESGVAPGCSQGGRPAHRGECGRGIYRNPTGHASDGRRREGRAIVCGGGCDSQGLPDRLCDPVPHRTWNVAQGFSNGGKLIGARP